MPNTNAASERTTDSPHDAPHETGNPSGSGDSGKQEGRHEFHFTYDDTGETAEVVAPNGWTMQRAIDEGYGELGESAQPDDRVEFAGTSGAQLMTPELRSLKVKEFMERHLSRDAKFHVVSKPGGAARRLQPRRWPSR